MQFETIKRVKNNQVTFGAWVYLKDPAVTEMIADAGFDWVIIDLEHGNLNEDLAQALMVPLKGTKCVPIVRIVSLDSDLIKKVLDTGALGIMVPQVQSADDAKSVVRAVRYSPQGARGMGYGRANGWGQRAKSYYQDANDSTLVVLTVESKQGVDNIDEIVAVPGVDVIFPGTYDLSGSLGVPGQFGHPLDLGDLTYLTVDQVLDVGVVEAAPATRILAGDGLRQAAADQTFGIVRPGQSRLVADVGTIAEDRVDEAVR